MKYHAQKTFNGSWWVLEKITKRRFLVRDRNMTEADAKALADKLNGEG